LHYLAVLAHDIMRADVDGATPAVGLVRVLEPSDRSRYLFAAIIDMDHNAVDRPSLGRDVVVRKMSRRELTSPRIFGLRRIQGLRNRGLCVVIRDRPRDARIVGCKEFL